MKARHRQAGRQRWTRGLCGCPRPVRASHPALAPRLPLDWFAKLAAGLLAASGSASPLSCPPPSALKKGRPSQGSRITDRASRCYANLRGGRMPRAAVTETERTAGARRELSAGLWYSGSTCPDPAKVFPDATDTVRNQDS